VRLAYHLGQRFGYLYRCEDDLLAYGDTLIISRFCHRSIDFLETVTGWGQKMSPTCDGFTYTIAGAGYQWYNGSVLENTLQRSSNQSSDQADVDGLTEGIIA
jgi:hypothetical protein